MFILYQSEGLSDTAFKQLQDSVTNQLETVIRNIDERIKQLEESK